MDSSSPLFLDVSKSTPGTLFLHLSFTPGCWARCRRYRVLTHGEMRREAEAGQTYSSLREHHVKRNLAPRIPQGSGMPWSPWPQGSPVRSEKFPSSRTLHPHAWARCCRVPRGLGLRWSPVGSHSREPERGKCPSELRGKLKPFWTKL